MISFAHRLRSLHDIFLNLTLLLAFFAVVTGSALAPWLIIGFPLSLAGAHLFYRAGRAHISQNRWWNALILTVLAASIVEYFTSPFANPMVIGVRFVLILITIKAFSRQGPRDEFQLYALSFLTLAAATTFNEDLAFGLVFGLYVLSGTFGLALFHLKTEAERHDSLRGLRTSPFDAYYFSALASISALIFASSLLIFFVFPRVGLGLFVEQSRESLAVAGFSQDISVGDHGTIRDNPAVVMRVEFVEERPQNFAAFRWRTMTFDHYENGGWSRTSQKEIPAPYSRSRSYDLDRLYRQELLVLLDDEPLYRAQIYLEPLGTNVLPTLWPARNIQLGTGNESHLFRLRSGAVTFDRYGDLRHTIGAETGMTYQIEVAAPPPEAALHRTEGRELPEQATRRYTQLPDMDPRVQILAEQITAGAQSNLERAQAIGDYFFREFQYTLELPEVAGEPVEAFLFETQRGHCEYFATAAAVMLRSVGVPTRIVNGFLGGTWNEVGDYLTVRQGDAHAWVEVYVPDLGWIPFDPTPPITSAFEGRSGLWQIFTDVHDALRQAWLKWILEYDLEAQFGLFRDAYRALAPAGIGKSDDGKAQNNQEDDDKPLLTLRQTLFIGGWLTLLITTGLRSRRQGLPQRFTAYLALFSSIAAGALWVGWFQGWTLIWTGSGAASVALAGLLPPLFLTPRQDLAISFAQKIFQSIESTAARAGVTRHPAEGPGDFLIRLESLLPAEEQSPIRAFRAQYLAIRFGGRPFGPHRRRGLQRLARRVCKSLRTIK